MTRILLGLSGFLLALGSPSTVLLAADLYVDPIGSDISGTGTQLSPWRTISHAVSQASAGDTIHVAVGSYDLAAGESFPIQLPSGVSLRGPNSGTALVDGSPAGTAVIEIQATAQATVVRNLEIRGDNTDSEPCIQLLDSHADLRILDNLITGGSHGVLRFGLATAGSSVRLENNQISGGGQVGIDWSAVDGDDLLVDQNTISGHDYGFVLTALEGAVDLSLTRNTISAGQDGATLWAIESSLGQPTSIDGLVSENTITGCGDDGLELQISASHATASIQPTIENNRIRANGGEGIEVLGFGLGGQVQFPAWVRGNTLTSNTQNGILLSASGFSVSLAPDLGGGVSGSLGRNSFASNGQQALSLNSATSFSARGNWWNASTGPGVEQVVHHSPDAGGLGTVDHSGFLIDPLVFTTDVTEVEPGDAVVVTAGAQAAFVPTDGDTDLDVQLGGVAVNNLNTATDGSFLSFVVPSGVAEGPQNLSVINPAGQSGSASLDYARPAPGPTPENVAGSGGGGCFLATATYGDHEAPQVRLLRSWRDRHLLRSAWGREVVRTYYRYSPHMAEEVAERPVLRQASRWLMAPVVGAVRLWMFGPEFYGLLLLLLSWRWIRKPTRA